MAKKKIPFINYSITRLEDYELISSMPQTKKIIFDRLLECVSDGVKANKDSIDIFKIYDTNQVIILEKEKWRDSLENAILFYIEQEDYEKCAECKKLIDNI